jgi:hypothetical protein
MQGLMGDPFSTESVFSERAEMPKEVHLLPISNRLTHCYSNYVGQHSQHTHYVINNVLALFRSLPFSQFRKLP